MTEREGEEGGREAGSTARPAAQELPSLRSLPYAADSTFPSGRLAPGPRPVLRRGSPSASREALFL